MYLLVGLGNPGPEYAENRHNIGSMIVDQIHLDYNFSPYRSKLKSSISDSQILGRKALIMKPLTFMNESGISVAEVLNFFKIEKKDVIVFHDELDLDFGTIRVKTGGGYAGHNGLKSIGSIIGSDFRRVRVGIGHPGDKSLVSNYVLKNFSKTERPTIVALVVAISSFISDLFENKNADFANNVAKELSKMTQT
ncbi:MAG: aminoacyl-tRNA hydrolase [Rhodospirillaceae bacterium]|nr:aminoacyl-tRNA hydrolase [Rhodospirillaceae bacterium]OUT79531.1 MAG: aminoacyl-tRNA hydrolase [Rhodospirillaceae bacterium TMED23]|tara:strand:+ start:302 stop:883 length:582 start_codon:yes stop_codon:yes gene_type:complete